MNSSSIIIYVIMGVVFAFIVMYARLSSSAQNQLRQNGVLVEGCIVGHRKENVWSRSLSPSYSYFLTYTYEYQGTTFAQEKKVSHDTYFAYPDGKSINVRCMSNNPKRAAPVDF